MTGERAPGTPVGPAGRGQARGAPVAALALAALAVAACSSGGTTLPAAAEPAAVEPPPAEPSTRPEPPPATAPGPATEAAPPAASNGAITSEAGTGGSVAGEGATSGAADANGAVPAGAGDDPPGVPVPEEAAPPAGLDAGTQARLHSLLDELAATAGTWSPAGRASLAVVTPDGTLYELNEHRQHISASAVKPIWAAAAIDLAGLDAVVPLAEAALVRWDNFAAGRIIDLIGIDTVNDWSSDVAGTTGTHLAAWHFGTDRVAQSVIAGGTRGNLTTVADLALFYARLRRGELLDPDGVAALEAWLRATARGSAAPGAVNGALLARLPDQVAAEAVHKTGWLPPYCCRVELRLVIDGGIVPLPGGGWFAIAAVSDRGAAYNLSVEWVALAACRVYVLLAGDTSHACDLAGDGTPRPELWPPPPEPEPDEPDEVVTPEDAEPLDDTEQADQPSPDEDPPSGDNSPPASEIPEGSESLDADDTEPVSADEE